MNIPLKSVKCLLLPVLMIFCSCRRELPVRLLPVYGEKKSVGDKGDTIYHQELPFCLTSQWKLPFCSDSVRGTIHVVDFFFVSCRSICPEMSKRMAALQKKYASDDSLLFVSITVNPSQDTVEALKAYADLYGALRGKWYLLTGNRDTIYHLARNSYLVNAMKDEEADQGFIHSELFVLVDPDGYLRGFYDGTRDDEIFRLENDIKTLKREIALFRRFGQPLSADGR